MTITAQAGIFGLGINDDGAKGGAVQNWYRYKALLAGAGPVVEQDVAPPEISGPNIPTGAYKTGYYYGGRVSLQPRLEGDFGWILLAATGQANSVAHGSQSGVYIHTFSYKDDAATFIPFFGARRHIPGIDTTVDDGDIGEDCVISAMTFNFPQVGPPSVDMDIMGRKGTMDDAPDLWTWVDTTEPYDSVPMVMKGAGLTLPNWAPGGGTQLPITSARISLINNTTTPQEERIIGSYFPDDYAARQRSMVVEATYKWKNADLCRLVFNGNIASGDFAGCIDFTDFELEVESPCDIDPGTIDYPWKLKFRAEKMFWQIQPLQLQGDDILQLSITGTAIEPDSGLPQDYMKVWLENAVTSYPLPAA